MREIKFRGRDVFKSKFFPPQWYTGGIMIDGDETWLCVKTEKKGVVSVRVESDTVGQYIGLKDGKGNEIYEGDIILVNETYPRVVIWDEMMWALMPTDYYHDKVFGVMEIQHPGVDWWKEFQNKLKVIGNIHDNPELIPNKQ